MIIKLDIKSDKELRAYIKDMIRGQVLSVAREEIKNIVAEVAEKKLKGFKTAPQAMVDAAIKEAVSEALKVGRGCWTNNSYIRKKAEDLINEEIKKVIILKK